MLAVRKRAVKENPSFAKKVFPSFILFSASTSLSCSCAWWAQHTLVRRRVSKFQVLTRLQWTEQGGRGTAEVWYCQCQTSSWKQSSWTVRRLPFPPPYIQACGLRVAFKNVSPGRSTVCLGAKILVIRGRDWCMFMY